MNRLIILAGLLAAAPAVAADLPATAPGVADVARVVPGRYKADLAHTQVIWTVNHMGFSRFTGSFANVTGTLSIDPRNPDATRVDVTIPLTDVVTTSEGLNRHLATPDFFDVNRFKTARFISRTVASKGQQAVMTGELTLHGITRPVTLSVRFIGAGRDPMSKQQAVGFEATGAIKRSDFGISYGVPIVSDRVDLTINAAFVKPG